MSAFTATCNQENDEIDALIAKLGAAIERHAKDDCQSQTNIARLRLSRYSAPTTPQVYALRPSVCLIARGAKRVVLNEEIYEYDRNSYLANSLNLPLSAQILKASESKPYLGLALELDLAEIARLSADGSLPPPIKRRNPRGLALSEVSAPLLNAFARLLGLLDKPEDIPILAPLIEREICYLLLTGDQGARLRLIAQANSQSYKIARSLDWLKENLREPLRIDKLAAQSGMSGSSFHRHFRALTAMSPLQFQKRLRLNEARRLMLAERMDAASAAFFVGYESPSQFSREYRRLFGAPPLRDIKSVGDGASAVFVQSRLQIESQNDDLL
jgi:AraC-like DNA-binding protein